MSIEKITELVGIIGAGLIPIAIFVPIFGVLLGVFPQAEVENIQLLFGIFPFFFGLVFTGLILFQLDGKDIKMSEEDAKTKLHNRNMNIAIVGEFASLFLIFGLFCLPDFVTSIILAYAGISFTIFIMIWCLFSLIWVGYWWNKK